MSLPHIVSAAAVPSESSLVRLTGNGFGVKAQPGPKLFDNIINQLGYDEYGIVVGDKVPTGAGLPWTANTPSVPNNNRYAVFSDSFPRHERAPINYRTWNYSGNLAWPEALGRENAPPEQRRIYASFWFRPDANISGTSHSSKFTRIWDNPNGTGSRSSWTQMHLTYNGNDANVSWPWWAGRTAFWNRLEVLYNADTHRIDAWTNCRLRHHITDYQKDPDQTRGLSVARIGFDRGGSNPPSVNSTFGEIYLDTTPARIEVGDAEEWDLCTAREVQLARAWDDHEVVFSFHRNAFPVTAKLYAFVVNEDGDASPFGAQITLGV